MLESTQEMKGTGVIYSRPADKSQHCAIINEKIEITEATPVFPLPSIASRTQGLAGERKVGADGNTVDTRSKGRFGAGCPHLLNLISFANFSMLINRRLGLDFNAFSV